MAKYSVQYKFAACFVGILAGLLLALNIFPILSYRDLVFKAKAASLQTQVTTIASLLSPSGILSAEAVQEVVDILDILPHIRVVVTDETGDVLYDSVRNQAFLPPGEIGRAPEGKQVFVSSFAAEAFDSWAMCPVFVSGEMAGRVCLHENDAEQARYIGSVQSALWGITIIVSLLSAVMIYIFSRALTIRITDLAMAVRRVGGGDYDYRISVRGNDELTVLGEEFNTLTDRLRQTEEARRRFVSDASHELKTPLASIRLLSDSILENRAIDEATARDFVSDIRSESERLERTAEKLLNLTRLDREDEIHRTAVDLGAVIRGTMHMISPLADQCGVRLSGEITEGCVIYAAEDDIYQVIFNLAENAIKYNVEGGRVELTLRREDASVVLFVDDTGIGIPEEDKPHVFSRFYRVDKARSRSSGGSGLGLSIVYDAVMLHGGTVEIADLNPGTRFEVRFPAYDIL